MLVLRCDIFSISISSSFYLVILFYSLTDLLSLIYQLESIFSFIVLNQNIWSIFLYFPLGLDSNGRENWTFFGFCHWFWLVFIMLYNCGRIFLILSFFVGYILSFGLVRLRIIRLSAHAGEHTDCSSRSCAEDVTITNVIIKPPDRKWDWGVNDVMPGIEGLGILVISEKSS